MDATGQTTTRKPDPAREARQQELLGRLPLSRAGLENLQDVLARLMPPPSEYLRIVGAEAHTPGERETVENLAGLLREFHRSRRRLRAEDYRYYHTRLNELTLTLTLPPWLRCLHNASYLTLQLLLVDAVMGSYRAAEAAGDYRALPPAEEIRRLDGHTHHYREWLAWELAGLESYFDELMRHLRELPPQPPQEPPRQRLGMLAVVTPIPIVATAEAILRTPSWESDPNDDERPVYLRRYRDGARVRISIAKPAWESLARQPELVPAELAWQVLQSFQDVRVGWTHLLLASYAHEYFAAHPPGAADPYDRGRRLIIPFDDIAHQLGLTKSHSMRRDEMNQRVFSYLRAVGSIVLLCQNLSRSGEPIGETYGHLWLITTLHGFGLRDDGVQGMGRWSHWAAEVMPSDVLRPFLGPGQQFGYLATHLIRSLDPYRRPLACKLAVYLTLQSRIAGGQTLRYTVRQLYEATGTEYRQLDARGRHLLFRRTWQDLAALAEAGCTVEFEGPDHLRPERQARPRGYWHDWLTSIFRLDLPAPTPQLHSRARGLPSEGVQDLEPDEVARELEESAPAAITACAPGDGETYNPPTPPPTAQVAPPHPVPSRPFEHRETRLPGIGAGTEDHEEPGDGRVPPRAGRQPREMVLTGAQMRVARTRAGLTQAQLAKILGRSRSFVALVEQGRRILGEDDARKLRELLDVQGEL